MILVYWYVATAALGVAYECWPRRAARARKGGRS